MRQFRLSRDIKDIKRKINMQILKPGMDHEDSIADLEWYVGLLERGLEEVYFEDTVEAVCS